jgi:putative salt-induced outer membrane protein
MRILVLVSLLLLPFTLHAADGNTQDSKDKHWKGEAELGLLNTSGNTETQSLNAKLAVEYQTAEWTHLFRAETLRAEDSGTKTADRDMLFYRARYQLANANFLFGSLRYDDDPFAGYDRRTTEVVGYGHQIIHEEMLKWDVEAGVGGRQTERTDNTSVDEAIVRVATNFEWRFTETSTFKQEVFVEHGSENTLTEATSDLKVKINSALAMKLTYKIKDNSDVPVGIEHTDTETAVTLVYDFLK